MIIQQRNIFLLDGIGALVSAIIMGLIIANYVPFFGLPKEAAYFLTVFPCLFMVYSLYCHFQKPKPFQSYLKMIIIANLLYCFISLGVVFYHYESLTKFGLGYLLLEKAVVLLVIIVELKVLKTIPE